MSMGLYCYIARMIFQPDEVAALSGLGWRSPVYPALDGAHTIRGWTGIGDHPPDSRNGWRPSVEYFAFELDFDDLSPLFLKNYDEHWLTKMLKKMENMSRVKEYYDPKDDYLPNGRSGTQ